MSPYYGKGGPFSMTSYYLTLLLWIFNLVAVVCLTSTVVMYFVAEYCLGPKGKNLSSMYRTQNILAKVAYGFIIASACLGILASIIGILPEFGFYEDYDVDQFREDDEYANKYIETFLPTSSHTQICSLGAFEVANKYGEKYVKGNLKTTEFISVTIFFTKLTSFNFGEPTDFSPLCNGALIPMMVLSLITLIFGAIVKSLYKKYMAKHGKVDESSSSSSSHHHKKSKKKSKSSNDSDSSVHEDASL